MDTDEARRVLGEAKLVFADDQQGFVRKLALLSGRNKYRLALGVEHNPAGSKQANEVAVLCKAIETLSQSEEELI